MFGFLTDILTGTPDQEGQLDPETKAARDFLLNRMLQLQSAGPVNVPTYQAAMPSFATAGQNQLLSALGMEGISAPSMPTANVGGMNVYTSMPMQTSMESEFARRAPAQYDYLRSFYMDPVTGEMGLRAYNPDVMGLDAGGMPTGGDDSTGPMAAGPSDLNAQLGRTPYDPVGWVGSYIRGGVNNPIENPTEQQMRDSTPPNMTYNPSTGSYVGNPISELTTSPRPVYRPGTPAPQPTESRTSSWQETKSAIKSDIDKLKSYLGL